MASLDEQKLSLLRTWGAGLERDEREEVAAAGRAILLLIDLWLARTVAVAAPEPEEEPPETPEASEVPDVPPARSSLGAALRHRLKSVGHFRAE